MLFDDIQYFIRKHLRDEKRFLKYGLLRENGFPTTLTNHGIKYLFDNGYLKPAEEPSSEIKNKYDWEGPHWVKFSFKGLFFIFIHRIKI